MGKRRKEESGSNEKFVSWWRMSFTSSPNTFLSNLQQYATDDAERNQANGPRRQEKRLLSSD